MTVAVVIDSCLQAVYANKTTEGFEVAMAPLLSQCLMEETFFELPHFVIGSVLELADEPLSVQDARKLVGKMFEKQGAEAVGILPYLLCGDIDSNDSLEILEPLQGMPIFTPFYEGIMEIDREKGKQFKKDEKTRKIEEENKKLKEENKRLFDQLTFLLQGSLAKTKSREIKKLEKKIENMKKMLVVSASFAKAYIPDDINIIDAVKLGNTDAVRALIVSDPSNLETIDAEYEATPLHWAAGWGKLDIIKILCDMGADVHARNKGGSTPFLCAAYDGHLDCMKRLKEYGADLNDVDNEGFSAAHLAADQGHLDIIQWLIIQGADLTIKTIDGASPLWIAAGAGQEAVVEFFIRNCRMSLKDTANRGNTILHQAAFACNKQIIKLCLKAGININVKTVDGLTPYDLAGDEETREYLMHKGCDVPISDEPVF